MRRSPLQEEMTKQAQLEVLALVKKKQRSTTDKYGQFVTIGLRYYNMREKMRKHRNDKVFMKAYRKVRRQFIDLRSELRKESIYDNILTKP